MNHPLPPVLREPNAVPRARVHRPALRPGMWSTVTEHTHAHGHPGDSVTFGVYALALSLACGPEALCLGLRVGGDALAVTLPAPDATTTVAEWWQRAVRARSAATRPGGDALSPPVVLDLTGGDARRPLPGALVYCAAGDGDRPLLWSVRPHVAPSTVERFAHSIQVTLDTLTHPEGWASPLDGLLSRIGPPPGADLPGTPTDASRVAEERRARSALVASTVERHSTVRAAHARFEEHPDGDVLACYVEPDDEAAPDVDALRAYLRLRLPPECVPTGWMVVDRIETDASGRVAPSRPAPATTEPLVRATLGRIWAEELGVETVGGDDDFFALGGDSLVATRVLARIRDELGADLDLGETLRLLSGGSLREAARVLYTRPRETPPEPLPSIEPRPEDRLEPFPLTDQQQAYALGRGETFSSGNIACHTYMEFEGRDLDPDRFRRAWERLARRHDMLRVQIDADTLTQRIDPTLGTDHVVHVDLTEADERTAEAELENTRHRLSHRVAELTGAPLYDVVVISLPNGRHRVCLGLDGLVADLAGTGVLYTELGRFYADPDAELDPVELSFRDYVLAERRAVHGEPRRRAKEYWTRRVADLPPAPDLPLARDPAEVTEPRFTPRPAAIDSAVWGRVRAQAASRGITPSGLLATCYAETLAGWSRSRHFTVNVPSFNRLPLHPDVGRAVGEFASLILVEVDARAEEPFADLARRVQSQIWRDLGHQHVTGVEVLRDLVRRHGGFGQAIMPYVFTSTMALSGDPTSLLEGRLRRVYRVAQTPQVWLDLIVEEAAGTLHLNWDSLDALFPEGLMDEMFAAFLRLVASLEDPAAWDRPARDPRPAEQVERHAAVAGQPRPLPEEPAHAGFWRQARAAPRATALIGTDIVLSYGELADRALRVAEWLRAGGVAANQPVAVVMGKGHHQIAGIHGILASGAPYLPLDADAPAHRTAALLDRAAVDQVLTTAHDRDEHWVRGRRVLELDTAHLPAPTGTASPDSSVGPRDLAYVLFTSGSTGHPKGVMVEHRSVLNCVRETTEALSVDARSRFLAVSAAHHDMSVYDLFGVLGAGGSLVLPDAAEHREAHLWADRIRDHGVTGWASVPAMMEMLLEGAEDGRLASLRTVILGGDWVAPQAVRALRDAAPDAGVRSIGGPTETTVWNIWHPVREEDLDGRTIPYGRAIANTRYRVLDTRLRDRPDRAVGELCCSGVSLARGYWDDPERTAAAFTTHPDTGDRLYRTGDLGYFRPDGLIEFVGRDDFQIKVRGQRVETGEIEAALLDHPDIAACVVTGVPHHDRPGYRALAGYYVPRAGADPGAAAAHAHLAGILPAHLVPATLLALPELPLNANGKVDRTALPAPDEEPDTGGDPPRGALEEVVANVWAEVLGVSVGRHDGFFELGGDSLLATRLGNRIREELPGAHLALRELFASPTVAGSSAAMLRNERDPARLHEVARLARDVAALDGAEVDARLRDDETGGRS